MPQQNEVAGPLTVDVAGQPFQLWPQRALYWPTQATLFIADPHFGKAAAFRHLGVPVPAGSSTADTGRLSWLLELTTAQRLVILGDFLHARHGREEHTLAVLERWRQRHSQLEIVLVRGNHDRGAGDPPATLEIRCVDEPWAMGDFACAHDPEAADPDRYTFAGHVHPAISLNMPAAPMRCRCYVLGRRVAVLPSFGSFTGSHPVHRRATDRIFALGPDAVVEV